MTNKLGIKIDLFLHTYILIGDKFILIGKQKKLILAGEQSPGSWSQRGAATASSITSSEIIIDILVIKFIIIIENSLDDDKDDYPNESPEPIVGSTFGRAWMDFNLFLDWILLAACSWQDPKPETEDDDDDFQY